ncbi:HYR domain-containing protein, partial [Geojedonia litorea]
VNNDAGQCGAIVNFTPTATDNCSVVSIVSSPASGSFFAVGTTTVTVTATDAAGNTNVCNFDVTVNDTEDPVVSCPSDITVNNDAGQCGAIVNFTPTATDNCSVVSIVSSPASGSFFAVGTTQVTVTATDAAGNTNVCNFDVTVNDTEDPVVSCPSDIIVSNEAGQCGAIVNFTPTATDNCSVVSIVSSPASGSFFAVGTTTVTVTATDAAGNTDVCNFDVTVNDTEDPVVSCPSDITVNNDAGQCGAIVNFTPTATDNCSVVSIVSSPASGSFFAVGTTQVTVTATDAAGNTDVCNFDVTVNDTEDPVVSCPSDITVNNDAGQCGAIVNFTPTATDNCSVVSIVSSPASGSFFAVGTTQVTVTATDAAGNTDVCNFDVTVNDTEDPVVSCPSDITVNNDAGQCGAIVNFTPTATDNCSVVSIVSSPASGSFFAVGTTTVTVTATDAAGNTDVCNFDVTVNDTEDPVVSCPSDITVSNEAGQCGAIVNFTPTATDNCSVASIVSSPASGSFFAVGTTTVTVTATDAAGNTDVCNFDVTVNDTEDPVVSCPSDITVNNDAGQCGAIVNFTPTATDNCSVVSIVSSPASGSFFAVGTTQVTVTATDAAGNTDV